jgi:polyisoprenoid-binding protein YceI
MKLCRFERACYLASLASLCLLLGCSNPADNVPAAKVSAPAETNAAKQAAATAPAAEPESRVFTFGPGQSKIEFVGSKVTGSHVGGFEKFEGTIRVAGGKVADKGNKVVIDTTSLYTDNQRLTGHLKSPDFFGTAAYPTATFESTAVEGTGPNAKVTGQLTLHGISKEISFPANIQVSDSGVALAAEFSINRFDFEMKYAGKADDLIRKEVVLKLNVKATPKTG